MTTSVLGSSLAEDKLWTMFLMDSMVPFLGVLACDSSCDHVVYGHIIDAHILKLPPTKNLRAMIAVLEWFLIEGKMKLASSRVVLEVV